MSAPSEAVPAASSSRRWWDVPEAWRTPLVWVAFVVAPAWVMNIGLVVRDWSLGDHGL